MVVLDKVLLARVIEKGVEAIPWPQLLIPRTCKSPEFNKVAVVISSVMVGVMPRSLVVVPSVHVH